MSAHPIPLALQTDDGVTVSLGRQLGGGGEANIYEVLNRREFVAKLYHADDPAAHIAKLREKEAKVLAMLARPPEISARYTTIAWPSAVLRRGGAFVGFLMPRAEGRILFRYHNPKERRKLSPNFDWFYLHRTAHNLCAIVDSIHRAGHVIADVNDQNFLVQDSALVSAVDTDSFQIKDTSSRWHLCTVGRPEFTPPELQGKSFAAHPREAQQDCFGLAVMIFQLLMEGSHPFRARLSLPHSVPEAQLYCIQHGHFPYDRSIGNPASPPPSGLEFNILNPLLQNLFRRCFVDGHAHPERRPGAAEWRDSLRAAEADLIACPQGHKHRSGLAECPWCARIKRLQAAAPPPKPPIKRGVLPTVSGMPLPRRPYVPQPGGRPPATKPVYRPRPRPPGTFVSNTQPQSKPWGDYPGGIVAIFIFLAMVFNGIVKSPDKSDSTTFRPRYNYTPPKSTDAIRNVPIISPRLELLKRLAHDHDVTSAKIDKNNRLVLTIGDSNEALLWDTHTLAIDGEPLRHKAKINSASFSNNSRWIVTASEDGTARVWDSESHGPRGNEMQHDSGILFAAFNPAASKVVTASKDNTAQIWLINGTPVGARLLHTDVVTMAVFSADGKYVATASDDGTARIWDSVTGEAISPQLMHTGKVLSVAFSPFWTSTNPHYLLTACADGKARLWSVPDGKLIRTFSHEGSVNSAVFSPDGGRILTAGSDGLAKVWNVSTGRLVWDTFSAGGPILSAIYDPTGMNVAFVCPSVPGRLWTPADNVPGPVPEQREAFTSVQFSSDGRYLVTTSGGTKASIWEVSKK